MSSFEASWLMISLVLLMLVYTLAICRLGGTSRKLLLRAAVLAAGWFACVHWILSTRALLPATIPGYAFLCLVFSVVAIMAWVLSRGPLRGVIPTDSQQQWLLPQGMRVFFGAGFLVLGACGQLPLAFGILDGVSHIGAGFLGLLAASFYSSAGASASHLRRAEALAWVANGFGCLDILVVAGTLAFVLLPELGVFHPMMYAVFLSAPVWLWLHCLSIHALWRKRYALACGGSSLGGQR